MTKMEVWQAVDELMEQEGFSCEVCPYAAECAAHEFFWGCGQWEDDMGEDL